MTEEGLSHIWDSLAKGHPTAGWVSWPHQDQEVIRHRDAQSCETWTRDAAPRTPWVKVP